MSGRCRDSMGYWGAVSIGVGGMVDAGPLDAADVHYLHTRVARREDDCVARPSRGSKRATAR